MKKHDPMGDRLKLYELMETDRRCEKGKPIIVRLDGKAFHTFTKGLNRPYDMRLSMLMVQTTAHLVEKTHALMGYTQSDEITLVFHYEEPSQPLYGGKFHKLTSILAAEAASFFTKELPKALPEKTGNTVAFDARVFQVPDKSEAANAVLWRWFDARKNSIAMLAQSEFSHRDLQGVDTLEMREMLEAQKSLHWEDYPSFFKWGTFVRREAFEVELSTEELARIPEDKRPQGPVKRSRVVTIDQMPAFIDVTNRIEFIFDGALPKTE